MSPDSLPAALALALALPVAPLAAQRPDPRDSSRNTPSAPAPPAGWSDFTRYFDARLDSGRVVGGSVLLIRDGRIAARHDHGLADRGRRQRVDGGTIFHYGSITKGLTAIAIMQLRDRGELSLDDPVTRWVPELRRVHDPYGMIDSITVRMLLSHSAGFQDPTWPYKEGKPWEPFEPTRWSQLVAMMPYQELHFRPGSRYGYSNPGYIYLARIIEAITGDPWETYVQKNVLAPLGLDRSYFGVTPYYLEPHRSNNYDVERNSTTGRDTVIENGRDFDPGITIPNGGWNAPLSDLAKYLAFLLGATNGDSARAARYELVARRATLREMWAPVVSMGKNAGGYEAGMGLGYMVLRRGDSTLIGHTGSQAGFRAFFWIDPETGDGVVGAINTGEDATSIAIQARALPLIR